MSHVHYPSTKRRPGLYLDEDAADMQTAAQAAKRGRESSIRCLFCSFPPLPCCCVQLVLESQHPLTTRSRRGACGIAQSCATKLLSELCEAALNKKVSSWHLRSTKLWQTEPLTPSETEQGENSSQHRRHSPTHNCPCQRLAAFTASSCRHLGSCFPSRRNNYCGRLCVPAIVLLSERRPAPESGPSLADKSIARFAQ